ncbi:MAG: N-acetylmuramoyl-L-alanine amidase [Deltaproteobacteria bacterium]|nr:N-acetylmuramoyl-L-alanine amidase [Deltaproteobacteria bacterium]MBZ0219504.1 N-acetylmuramoyl-L-alanine amidase [Deltaproteobacteria bacterium]
MGKYLLAASVLLIALSFSAAANGAESRVSGPMVVVIDPGHGGEDTGAKGPSGLEEKDVTLRLALGLAETLKKRDDLRVLLTRTADVFIPLEERTAFANRNGADLFISIHANAASNKDAIGIETFFLSFEATDEDARRLAAFENSAGAHGAELAAAGAEDDIKSILLDLANTMSHHESSAFAEMVHTTMVGGTGRENRGVKQAPFTVLVGATMPAVLIEVGFISNPSEEKWLSKADGQARLAESIAEGILSFKDALARKRGYIEVSGRD